MGKYISAPETTLRLTGRSEPVNPGDTFEHDFSETGPEGEHGPAREAALLAAGAVTRAEPEPVAEPAEPVAEPIAEPIAEPAAPEAAQTTDESPARSTRRKKE